MKSGDIVRRGRIVTTWSEAQLLPKWLPDLTVLDLRAGKDLFDIRFWRDGEQTRFEVLRGNANAVEGRAFDG